AMNEEIRRFQAAQASAREAAKPSASELRASEADHLQGKPLETDLPPEEQAQMEANLRGLAVALRREGETDEQAFERVKQSKYLITFRHDEYWPFYHVEHKFGRVILTLNTAHPFFTKLYDPVQKMEVQSISAEDGGSEPGPQNRDDGPVVALELLLLSLARTQSMLTANDPDIGRALETLRREWSEAYRIQLA
ncbi:MAG TPA: ATP-binding protein, partial [Dehalococcoidia bacterium]|nr:ATP-binding protein [Dehalococcoidia bacterium]